MSSTRAAPRSPGTNAGRTAAASRVFGRRDRALAALVVAAVAGASLAAQAPLGVALTDEAMPTPRPTDAFAWLWSSLCLLFPGTEPVRWAALACVFAVGSGACAGWLGHQLFRGPGRVLAAFAASLLATSASCSWVRATTPSEQFPTLPFVVLALLSVTALVRPLVHLGRAIPVAFARALAAATAGAVVLPSAGVPLVLACVLVYVIRGRRIADLRGVPTDASLSRATMSGNIGVIVLAAVAAPVLAALAAWPGRLDAAAAWGWLAELHPIAPPLELVRPHLHPVLIYPALTLVVLLVLPLRWRGGVTLLGLLGAALTVGDADGPLAPLPVLLCGIAVAASGWIWLAGTVTRRPAFGHAFALATTAALVALAWPQPSSSPPRARALPTTTLARSFARAATSPGDVLVLHDRALERELSSARVREGLRPDLGLVAAAELSSADLDTLVASTRAQGRRLLSDAFDLGGHRDPRETIEVGTLYWITFDRALAERAESAEIPEPPAVPMTPQLQARWTRLQLERARFRRATGREPEAVLALPLGDERRSLRTAMRVSQAINLPAQPGSELGRVGELEAFSTRAAVLAEAGDSLLGAGEHTLGLAMLTESAREGYPPAWRALARWQLELGQVEDAAQTRREMAGDPALRDASLDVLWWLTWKGRHIEAFEWRDHLDAPSPEPVDELAARLAVLSRSTDASPPAVP